MRQPNWWKLGYETASGLKKSSMSLPDDFFDSQAHFLMRKDFNLLKFAHDYAIVWLETEQWRKEVGQKMYTFVKNIQDPDERTSYFLGKAYLWADGYSSYIVNNFMFIWYSTQSNIRGNISVKGRQKLEEQGLYHETCGICYTALKFNESHYSKEEKRQMKYYHKQCIENSQTQPEAMKELVFHARGI